MLNRVNHSGAPCFFVSNPGISCFLLASMKQWQAPDPSQILKLLTSLRESCHCWHNLHLPMRSLPWKEAEREDESSNIINFWEGKGKRAKGRVPFLHSVSHYLKLFIDLLSVCLFQWNASSWKSGTFWFITVS